MNQKAASGRLGRMIRRSSAGLMDAGAASLAAFAASIYAVRVLEPDALGAHALAYSAVLLAGAIPMQLIFTPVLADSVSYPRRQRIGYLLPALGASIPITAALTGLTLLLYFALPRTLSVNERLILAIAAAIAVAFDSAQVFSRQLLHYSAKSLAAAMSSLGRLLGVVGGVALLHYSSVPAVAIPLLAIALGDALVLLMILAMRRPNSLPVSRRDVAARGVWLVGAIATPRAANFIASQLVILLAGAEYLGYAEAARVAAQPILVGVMGISAITDPVLMEAASRDDAEGVRKIKRRYAGVILIGAACYSLIAIPEWPGNFMQLLAPLAFTVPGLVGVAVFSAAISALSTPHRTELISKNLEHAVFRAEIPSSLGLVVGGLSAVWTQSFARPTGVALAGIIRLAFLTRASRLSEPNASHAPSD